MTKTKKEEKLKNTNKVGASRDTIGSTSNLNLNKSGVGNNNRKINFAS